MNKKTLIILGIVAFVALGLVGVSTLFLTQTNQDNRSSANEPTPPIIPPSVSPISDNSFTTSNVDTTTPTPTPTDTATPTPTASPTPTQAAQTSCQQPSQVTNVKVQYPGCDSSGQCSFVQATCNWDANADATSYTLKVTEVETNTVVLNQSEPAGTTQVFFNITQGKTYRCDVSAVNSCGAVSVAASDQLLCEANGLVNPTPTLTETPTASPTAIVTATETPRPTLPPTGPAYSMVIGVAAAVGIILFGGILFIL